MINKDKKLIIRIMLWISLIVLMSVIYYFSSQQGGDSKDTSNVLLYKLIQILPDYIIKRMYIIFGQDALSKLIRKTAHFVLYLLLGSTSYGLCLSYFNKKPKIMMLLSLIFCIVYASSDEIHQCFVPGRSGQPSDVFLDTIGAAFGILIVFFIAYIYKKRKFLKN